MNHRTIQHRTPNAEHRMAARTLAPFAVRCSMLDVRCFPSAQGFQRANVHFGEISPRGRGPVCGETTLRLPLGVAYPRDYSVRKATESCAWAASTVPTKIHECRRRRATRRSEEHTSELQSQSNLVCRLLLEKK